MEFSADIALKNSFTGTGKPSFEIALLNPSSNGLSRV